MQKIDLYTFYHLGLSIQNCREELRSARSWPRKNDHLSRLKMLLESFLSGTESVNLIHTRREVEKTIARIDKWISDQTEAGAALDGHFRNFRYLFKGESQDLNVFAVSQKGTHSILSLLERAHENLSADIRSRLSPETINDITQAGRCLAFECHTAVGFHILRAVETLIRAYHQKLTASTVVLKNRNWGAYIRALNTSGADPKVTGYLEHIKDHYRNPIVHPEAVLTADEAFSLFNACLSAITLLDGAIEAVP